MAAAGATSLRRRLYAASAALIALQVVGTVAGFASWEAVRRACAAEDELAGQRRSVMELASAAREVYVHQAHTLIEGGPAHLPHLAEVAAEVKGRLDDVRALPLPADADVDGVATALAAADAWFAAEVSPLATGGHLDQPIAVRLHTEADRRASEIDARISAIARALDGAQAREREAISLATRRAWVAVALLTIGGALLGALVASRLARSILAPVEGLHAAAAALGAGSAVPPAAEGDDELGALGRAFNRMVEQMKEAERRLVESERLAALGQMSGAVAHELMNPLAVILADPAMRAEPVAA
jgi:HAMP domain-containing protein